MKSGQMVGKIAASIFRLALAVIIIMLVYKAANKAYNYGFRVFAETPISEEPGTTVTVAIVDGKTPKEIGQILQDNGLIRDAKLFSIQEKLSEYKDQLKPGIYELSTAMTPEEMMAIMAVGDADDTGEITGNSDGSEDTAIDDTADAEDISGNSEGSADTIIEGADGDTGDSTPAE